MGDSRRRSPWEWPECPGCDSHLFVDRMHTHQTDGEYRCHQCDRVFDAPEYTPPACGGGVA